MRFDTDTIQEIEDALTRNKRRTLLTGFGIFWGVFMLLFMLGGGAGLEHMLSKNFEGFASNAMIIASQTTTKPYKGFQKGRYWDFKTGDIERLRTMVPELDVVTAMNSQWGQTAVHGEHSMSINMKGVNADYAKVEEPSIRYGRYLTDLDNAQERKVCVIGKQVYESLFPDGGDPCGEFIKVGSVYYKVVGVDVSSGNINLQGNAGEAVTIPLKVMQKVYHQGDVLGIICLTGKEGVVMSTLTDRIRSVTARAHLFDPDDEKALMVMNTEEIYQMMDSLFRGVNLLILLVGIGTILAGAVGVSNIMMVNVKARTVEIGIRRAIGATPADILSQIMLESVALTVLAGCLGILLSVGVLSIMQTVTGDASFQIAFSTGIGALGLLAVLGVAAGLAPSIRAMRIRPVEAMRDE